jgi:hypothetical protein
VTNADGINLRLWINPKDGKQGIEPINWDGVRDRLHRPPDYRKFAADLLERGIRDGLEPSEFPELVESVVKQWKQFDGLAAIFLDPRRVLLLRATRNADGTYYVAIRREGADLASHLARAGVRADSVGEVIVRFNRAEFFEYRDEAGNRHRLWNDPKARRVWAEQLDGIQPRPDTVTAPVACPRCSAILPPWVSGQQQQICRFCKHVIALD